MSNIKQLSREQYPDASWWDTLDKEGQKVFEIFGGPEPKSLVRVGDGEARIFRFARRVALAGHLARAIKHADCFGVIHSKPGVQLNILNGLKHHRVEVDPSKWVNAFLFGHAPEWIGRLSEGKRVLWITSDADKIVKNLNNPHFRDFYLLNGIVSNDYINAMPGDKEGRGPYPGDISKEQMATYRVPPPSETADFDLSFVPAAWETPCPHMAYVERSYLNIRLKLTEVQDFDLALVGAGVVGKLVCHHIKTVLGRSAIDIGSIMSPLRTSP